MRYEILDGQKVVNTIVADEAFMRVQYPDRNYREAPDPTEAAAIRRAGILAQLDAIDAQTAKPRTMRELQLGNAATVAWVQALDAQAVALRTKL